MYCFLTSLIIVSGVHLEPGLEWSKITATAVLFNLADRGQRARHSSIQV